MLYRLDPRQFQIALDNAKANLAQIGLTIDAMKRTICACCSDVEAQQAQVDLDQINYDRNAVLLKSAAMPKAAFDQANYHAADRQERSSRLAAAAIEGAARPARRQPGHPTDQHPQYLQAKAQVDEAQRQLDHAIVKAPFAGIVTNVPSIAPGKYLAASTTAFYLVDTDHVWVEATPKETELTYVRAGQPATVTVDTYPDCNGTARSRA